MRYICLIQTRFSAENSPSSLIVIVYGFAEKLGFWGIIISSYLRRYVLRVALGVLSIDECMLAWRL